jgi:hypothetical protein
MINAPEYRIRKVDAYLHENGNISKYTRRWGLADAGQTTDAGLARHSNGRVDHS